MTKEERKEYNRNYYRKHKERISAYKAHRYATDPEYKRTVKLSVLRRRERLKKEDRNDV